jgi:hypothetical protein
MEKFEELKKEFIEILRDKSPCQSEYKRVLTSIDQAKLLKIIYDNLSWCIEHNASPNAFLIKFDADILLASGLANTGLENIGIANSGDRNSGNRNSGDRNSGDRNSGNWNSGDRNSGDRNSGNRNSGDRNSGDRNSGNRNSGDRNSGDSNSGYRNSGNWNSGNRNSGDSNSGYRNSGAFCLDPNPKLVLFDVQTDIYVKDWEQMEPCRIMIDLTPNIWVESLYMTDKEKEQFPTYEILGGYLKSITMHEAWSNLWGNLTDEKKEVFTSLPHFDKEKFKAITGITV